MVDIQGSGLKYNAGDSLGVFARNPDATADEILKLLKLDPSTPVSAPAGSQPLRDVLTKGVILNRVSQKFVKALQERLPEGEKKKTLGELIANKEAFDKYTWDRDYIDVLIDHPGAAFTADELVGTINKAQPRLYSIASSGLVYPEHVHLTVAIVRYQSHNRWKHGFCSGFMADHAPVGSREVPVYVQPTKHFHMPPGDAPIIMVGPAPASPRSAPSSRSAPIPGPRERTGSSSATRPASTTTSTRRSSSPTRREALLTRLDLAFSRDQAHKVYVQDKMRESGARTLEVAPGRRLLLRLRRRQADGQGRAPGPDRDRGPARRPLPGEGGRIHRADLRQGREAVPQGRLLNRKAKGFRPGPCFHEST